ncbi:MAG TPA: S-adenosylmethionine:tRNA ribosyltransferase-isomerase, partial [Lamprocystis sp. (in: g-proteobacteria)]|nr:S-adenosylmethionine:tRNA ribosyltransferase-isomerase [Lamprocystis sp. (in: g-proteobacteria)]
MQHTDFQFDLPPELIAQRPLPRRGDSRLLVLAGDGPPPRDQLFTDLPGLRLQRKKSLSGTTFVKFCETGGFRQAFF